MRFQTTGEIRCNRCRRVLGVSDGMVLQVAGVIELFNRAAMSCQRCGKITIWREVDPPEEPPTGAEAVITFSQKRPDRGV